LREVIALLGSQIFILHDGPQVIDLLDFQAVSGPRRSRRVC
jgi:hypothetical protein